MSQFLDQHPPPLKYFGEKRGKTTSCSVACIPQSVVEWKDFQSEVIRHCWYDTPKYPHPDFIEHMICCEEEVRQAFSVNVLRFLQPVVPAGMCSRHNRFKIERQPDFVYGISQDEVRLVIEIKTKWSLSMEGLIETWAKNLASFPRTDLLPYKSNIRLSMCKPSPIWSYKHL